MIALPLSDAFVHGAAELEATERGVRPHRLPLWVRAQFPDPQLLMMEAQPSGVRIVMRTTARSLELSCHPTRLVYRGTRRPRGAIDLVVDGELAESQPLGGGDRIEADLRTRQAELRPGPSWVARFDGLPAHDKRVELWLPHNESIELAALRADAPLEPALAIAPVWMHHGSSISHGSHAASPTRIWPAVAARAAGVELRNLGLGGSALVDPFLARTMRDAPADLISVKLGINVVNLDAMRLRAFVPAVHGFLDTIREGHPSTPLILISPLFCPIHEDTPGPGAVDPATLDTDQVRFIATGRMSGEHDPGRLTLRIIRDALAEIVDQRTDPELHLLDGTSLYSATDAEEHPLPDGLHPDTGTHELIGVRFAAWAFGPGGPFGQRLLKPLPEPDE